MKAVVVQEKGKAIVTDAPEPKVRPDYVKVKTVALALNPTDWKHVDYISDKGAISGCDYAGEVVEVGSAVKSDVNVGDRIAGVCHGGNVSDHEHGAFAEYALQKDGAFAKIPSSLTFEEASTLGVGITTVAQGLYQSLELPWPDKPATKPFPVLIYGGSTATGALAIQFAKLSGLEVITTASAKNFDYVKSLGADQAFDYKSPTCAEDIRKATNNSLRYVFDCISLEGSVKICADALSSDSSSELHYSALLPFGKFPRDDVNARSTMAYTAMNETYEKMGRKVVPDPADYDYAVKFWKLASKLLAEGKIKVHTPQVGKGGLEGVLEGMQLMREDKVSGVKLVYRTADTPGVGA